MVSAGPSDDFCVNTVVQDQAHYQAAKRQNCDGDQRKRITRHARAAVSGDVEHDRSGSAPARRKPTVAKAATRPTIMPARVIAVQVMQRVPARFHVVLMRCLVGMPRTGLTSRYQTTRGRNYALSCNCGTLDLITAAQSSHASCSPTSIRVGRSAAKASCTAVREFLCGCRPSLHGSGRPWPGP